MDKPADVYEQILEELEYQKSRWSQDFDDKNTLNDWVAYIVEYATKASSFENVNNYDAQETALIKTAALCFAALIQGSSRGWNPRHYDMKD